MSIAPSRRAPEPVQRIASILHDAHHPSREHLAALDRICLLPCEEYSDLKAKVAAYKKGAR